MSEPFTDKIDDLVSSIDELEAVLEPLLATPLSKLTNELSAPLDRAKLQVWLSYLLNDLIWSKYPILSHSNRTILTQLKVHLKSRGINPSKLDSGEPHTVVAELVSTSLSHSSAVLMTHANRIA